MSRKFLQFNDLEIFGSVERLAQERRFDPLLLFVENCQEIVNDCKIATYEAG